MENHGFLCVSPNKEVTIVSYMREERERTKRVDCKWWSTDLLTTTDINLTFFDPTPTSIFGKGRRPNSNYLSTARCRGPQHRECREANLYMFASVTQGIEIYQKCQNPRLSGNEEMHKTIQ